MPHMMTFVAWKLSYSLFSFEQLDFLLLEICAIKIVGLCINGVSTLALLIFPLGYLKVHIV